MFQKCRGSKKTSGPTQAFVCVCARAHFHALQLHSVPLLPFELRVGLADTSDCHLSLTSQGWAVYALKPVQTDFLLPAFFSSLISSAQLE